MLYAGVGAQYECVLFPHATTREAERPEHGISVTAQAPETQLSYDNICCQGSSIFPRTVIGTQSRSPVNVLGLHTDAAFV